MKIQIYQVNTGRDRNRVVFQNYEDLERFQGFPEIDSQIYDRVYEGEMNCKYLEDVYRVFNTDHPEGYK